MTDSTFEVVGTLIGTLLVLLFLGVMCIAPFFVVINTTKGQHTGVVTAVDQSGFLFKNYTVYFKTDSGSSQEDSYCVNRDNTDLANKLKEAAKTKKVVTIEYSGNIGVGLALCHHSEIRNIE